MGAVYDLLGQPMPRSVFLLLTDSKAIALSLG